jgi:S-adenosylmethionine synthetase
MLVQISYAIGIARPLSVYVDTYGSSRVGVSDGEIARRIERMFDLRPASIVRRFGLKNPIFEPTASYGHFGQRPYTAPVRFIEAGREVVREVEFFGWEKLNAVDEIKKEFNL